MSQRTIVAMVTLFLPVVAFFAASQAQAQQSRTRGVFTDIRELPDTPAGQRAKELLAAVNSNDPAKVRSFIEQQFTEQFRGAFPMADHLQVFADVYRQSGGFEFYGVRKYEEEVPPGEIVVIARAKLTDAWNGLIMEVEPSPPHRIAGLNFSPARPPKDVAPAPKLTDEQIAGELREFMERLVKADVFSGSVLLARNGNVLFQNAYGEACKSFHVPNKLDTKFNLGSMNKMFTAVAVLQIVQAGKLSLDDPLSKFLSTDWLPREVTDKIRIKHLLTHTSGLGSYFNDKFMNSSRELYRNVNDYKPLVIEETLAFEPGTKWRYSNTGFLLLGAVIESVTGGNYYDYIRENIYKPAGMTNSDCFDVDEPIPNLAVGYSQETRDGKPVWVTNVFKHVIRGGPAGGGYSTAEDLLRFDKALRSNKLLDAEHLEMLWTSKPELGSSEYGFGFGVFGEPGARIVGHSGGFPGISSNLDMFLDSGFTAVVLSNYDEGSRVVNAKLKELVSRTP